MVFCVTTRSDVFNNDQSVAHLRLMTTPVGLNTQRLQTAANCVWMIEQLCWLRCGRSAWCVRTELQNGRSVRTASSPDRRFRTTADRTEGSELPAVRKEGSELPAVRKQGSELPAVRTKGSELQAVTTEGSELPKVRTEVSELPTVRKEDSEQAVGRQKVQNCEQSRQKVQNSRLLGYISRFLYLYRRFGGTRFLHLQVCPSNLPMPILKTINACKIQGRPNSLPVLGHEMMTCMANENYGKWIRISEWKEDNNR